MYVVSQSSEMPCTAAHEASCPYNIMYIIIIYLNLKQIIRQIFFQCDNRVVVELQDTC